MEERAIHALELDRVLSCLAGFTVSEAGFRACLALRPFSEASVIEREAALFEQGRLFALRSGVKLASFPDINGLLAHLGAPHSLLDLDDLFALRGLLEQGNALVQSIRFEPSGAQTTEWPLWVAEAESLPLPQKSLAALRRCLSDDGLVRDEASPELLLVRGELRRLHRQCTKKVKDYAAEYNILHFLQDSFMTLSSDRYVLPLKTNFKGRLQGVIHDYSQTGETCYFEPMFLVELNNRLQELKREEREEERKILAYLTALAREEAVGLRALYDFLVSLDLLFARSALAACYDGRLVEFAEGRGILLREARHPLLALAASPAAQKAFRSYALRTALLSGQPVEGEPGAGAETPPGEMPGGFQNGHNGQGGSRAGKTSFPGAVASTLELLPDQQALVISGGNAGGKTVSLKSLGLITLMSLCALPVPVENGSVLPLMRNIYAFIGDEQSLDDHVSTFTAQITHLGRIWPKLGPDSLVILDEFGAGTDPSQGAALAQAVVDSLMAAGARVVAATHFPALKAYALSTGGVRAASVLFDPATKKPLFRLVYDQVGASQALDVAREHGLPEEVLKRAEQYLLLSGEDSSALVERLNALAVTRESELAALAKEKRTFTEKRKELRERFEAEREKLFSSVQAEAQSVLADWKKTKISHKQALKELARIRAPLAPAGGGAATSEAALPREELDVALLTLRQRVRHLPWKRVGVVLEVDPRKKRVRLDFDGVSLWAEARDIALLDEKGGAKNISGSPSPSAAGGTGAFASQGLPLSLDLRGMRADVAVSSLEKFLDGAIISGRDDVEIIHGRGTGVLRKEIHLFLKHFPAVREYRLAPEDQGGDGKTIVGLK